MSRHHAVMLGQTGKTHNLARQNIAGKNDANFAMRLPHYRTDEQGLTMPAWDALTEKQAIGIRSGRHMKLVCAFDIETWQDVRARAAKQKISVAEQVRRLVEIGLEDDDAGSAGGRLADYCDQQAVSYERTAAAHHQVRTVPEPQLSKLKAQHWRILAKAVRDIIGHTRS